MDHNIIYNISVYYNNIIPLLHLKKKETFHKEITIF